MAGTSTSKTYEVIRKVVERKRFEVIASDVEGAESAVFWRNSSGREMADARWVGDLAPEITYEVRESTEVDVCSCGHFLAHHTPGGCGWQSCECEVMRSPA